MSETSMRQDKVREL